MTFPYKQQTFWSSARVQAAPSLQLSHNRVPAPGGFLTPPFPSRLLPKIQQARSSGPDSPRFTPPAARAERPRSGWGRSNHRHPRPVSGKDPAPARGEGRAAIPVLNRDAKAAPRWQTRRGDERLSLLPKLRGFAPILFLRALGRYLLLLLGGITALSGCKSEGGQ